MRGSKDTVLVVVTVTELYVINRFSSKIIHLCNKPIEAVLYVSFVNYIAIVCIHLGHPSAELFRPSTKSNQIKAVLNFIVECIQCTLFAH